MAVDTRIYDNRFFKNTKKLESASAKETAEIILNNFYSKSIIDIGCGAGIYLKEFEKRGIEVLGVDGSPAAMEESEIKNKIVLHDLCKPFNLKRKFDLCLCFEVAEHLPPSCSETLIQTLINLSDKIVFTAATPGQGPASIGHINEQSHIFWIKMFRQRNFRYERKLSYEIRNSLAKKDVVWWIVKNLMVFANEKQ